MTGAYTDLVNNASNVASQPLQLYNGPLVAGLTDQQNQAVSGIGAAANSGAPGFAQAQDYINKSATPITPEAYTPEAIQKYMSPYTQNVVDATQRQFDLTNAGQQSGLRGNAASAGALGGDREAILQAQLAGQQRSAQDPIIAGLYQSGFNQAQGEFNTQQGVGLNAAQANNASAANAGYATGANTAAAQNSALAGNQAYLNAAGLQQGINQANLNVPYEQYLQQQAYPYQNLDFLSQILGGAAQGSGTTTDASKTTPFNIGNFIANGAASLAGGAANGGRIGLAAGGVPDVSVGYVPPPMQIQTGHLPSAAPQNMDDPSQGGTGGGLSIRDLLTGGKGIGDWIGGAGTSEAGKGAGALGLLGFDHGGRTRLADGGIDDPDNYIRDVLAGLAPPPGAPAASQPAVPAATTQPPDAPPPAGATMLSAADTPPDWRGQATNFAPPAGIAGAGAPPAENPTWDDGTPVASGGAGLADAGAPAGQRTIWQAPEADTWHSVLAGLGGFLSRGLGAGINAGLKDYDDQMDPHPVVDHSGSTIMISYGGPGKRGQIIDTGIPTEAALNSKAMADWRRDNTDMNRDTRTAAIGERADAAAAAVAQRAEAARQASADRANALEVARINATAGRYGQPVPGMGVGPDGKPVPGAYIVNAKTGEPDFHAGMVLTPTGSMRSLPAMVSAKFMQEHPDATAEDAENFAADYTRRTTAARAFGTGPQGNAIRSFNVGLSHLDTLGQLADAMGNGNVQGINRLRNAFRTQFGSDAPVDFNSARQIVGAEIVKAVTGAAGALGDRETAEAQLNAASSPEQLAGVIRTYKNLMAGQLHGLRQQYETSTGNNDFDKLLSPTARTQLGGPKPGDIRKGYKFKGGNPADPHSWDRVAP